MSMPDSINIINSPHVYQTGNFGFSQAVVFNRLIFGSGQVGWDKQLNLPHTNDFAQQFGQTLRNITQILNEGESNWQDVILLRFYIVDLDPEKREHIGKFLKETYSEQYAPATTMIGVAALARKELLIEIEFIAKTNTS